MISPTDPCSAWIAKANKRVQFGYGLNYMIDTGHAVIVSLAQIRPTPPTRDVAHSNSDSLLLANQKDKPLAARNARVEKVPLTRGRHKHECASASEFLMF